jgi:hypothetical protein
MRVRVVIGLLLCGAVAPLPGCSDGVKCRAMFDRRCNGQVLEGCRSDPEGVKFGWVTETDCTPGYCVQSPSLWRGASCALEPEPRPSCVSGLDEGLACDGAELILCAGGYVIGSETCASPDLCAPDDYRCLTRPGQDPACPTDGFSLQCDGEIAIFCVSGFCSAELDCGAVGCGNGRCLASGTPDSRCQAGTLLHGVCAGNVALECDGDYLVREYDCGVYRCRPGSWTWSVDSASANGCDYRPGWGNG